MDNRKNKATKRYENDFLRDYVKKKNSSSKRLDKSEKIYDRL